MTTPADNPLHVFYDGSEWVIARDKADASAVWCAWSGAREHDDGDDAWEQKDEDATLSVTTYDGPKGADYARTLTLREWIAENGHGFLCSENI